MEILIAVVIVFIATFILIKNFKKSSKGGCNCNNCPSKCSKYKK